MNHPTEFVAFPIKPGLESRAAEWLRTLVERQAECLQTLEREAMHYESIFRVVLSGVTYFAWFSVQGSSGKSVHSSPHPIDQIHTQFWEECVDRSVPPIDFKHVVSFVPPVVAAAISEHERLCGNGAA